MYEELVTVFWCNRGALGWLCEGEKLEKLGNQCGNPSEGTGELPRSAFLRREEYSSHISET